MAQKCRHCGTSLGGGKICPFCKGNQELLMPKATLPANAPGRSDVQLKYAPRGMFPYHAEGITVRTNKYSVPFVGKPWTYDLIAIPMESVRRTFRFHKAEDPRVRRNLQIWVDNLGPALYNPVAWRLQMFYKMRPPTAGKYLVKKGTYIRQIDGAHRIRALEALDFNFVYLLFALGFPTISEEQQAEMMLLFKPAFRYYRPRRKTCVKCKQHVRWITSKDGLKVVHKCTHCGHNLVEVLTYPEPV